MGEDEQNGNTEQVSMQTSKFPTNPPVKFNSQDHFPGKSEKINHTDYDDEEEEMELSLGLSMNGRFGVDPKRAKNLIRSSSISNFMMRPTFEKNSGYEYTPITRTCSLPVETEEEWRKRKELQSIRRMEAKRKRLEKINNVRVVRDQKDVELGKNGGGVCEQMNGNVEFSSQCSILSQGSCSSSISDFKSPLVQGTNKYTKVSSIESMPQQIVWKPEPIPVATNSKPANFYGAALEIPSMKVAICAEEAKKKLKNMMVEMPYVTTKGGGPHGKRIEGFLYRYRKGEEVRIVCVCHGNFLSPAEFVKHAGGGDVAHPLKHIAVTPAAFL